MSQKNETLPLLISFLVTLGLIGGGVWFFKDKLGINHSSTPSVSDTLTFSLPSTVPAGVIIRIDGSTSMVQINQTLKKGFESQFYQTTVETKAGGSDKGLQDVLIGNVDLAAVSRPLTPNETSQGLVAVPVAKDAIAIMISQQNPFSLGLTQQQVKDIFQGKITQWSEINPKFNGEIKVINRPPISGTYTAFKELVLGNEDFGNFPNLINWKTDELTGIIRGLGSNGISYGSYDLIKNQITAKVIPIDGVTPSASSYPYQRELFYVYKNPPTNNVKYFLGYALSSQGKQSIAQ